MGVSLSPGSTTYFLPPDAVVLIHEVALVNNLLLKECGVARIDDVHFAHHLAHDYLEMLVVDLHALHAVNVLNLVHDVLLHGSRAHDVEDVGGRNGTVGERSAGTHIVVLLHENLLRQGHEIFLLLAEFGDNRDFTVTAFHAAEVNFAVDFADDGGVARVAGLESSVTRGRPPVISPAPPVERVIFTNTSPGFTS